MAHVMTYDEIVDAAKNDKPIYEELRGPHVKELKFNGIEFSRDAYEYLLLDECDEEECMDYNWNYRCWNEPPTEEEMVNTPWKADPYAE